ncbi:MAG TPA: PTS mannose/fructose/sorbose transporter subunit IIB [Proteobacteria bacterium]|nr:PTS mannose/fructose/sorbose transporter subunit IIB [Pseudomonadota bacterium]
MRTVLYRVDDRLIHGQIVAAWVPYTRATRIVVADNQLPANLLQSRIIRLAAPPKLRVEILSVRQAASLIGQQRSGPGLQTIMLFAGLEAVVQALDEGLFLTELNLGNLRQAPGKLQIAESISLSRAEIGCLQKLEKEGLKITIQPVPSSPEVDVFALLRRKGL